MFYLKIVNDKTQIKGQFYRPPPQKKKKEEKKMLYKVIFLHRISYL